MGLFEPRRRIDPSAQQQPGSSSLSQPPSPSVSPSVAPSPWRVAAQEAHAAGTDRVHARHRTRPAEVLDAVVRLDRTTDDATRTALAAWLSGLYSTEYQAVPLGLVARCLLGKPYADHILTLDGQILEHYPRYEPMPAPYDAARMLARSSAYAFIEVYSNGLAIPVREDGTAVVPD